MSLNRPIAEVVPTERSVRVPWRLAVARRMRRGSSEARSHPPNDRRQALLENAVVPGTGDPPKGDVRPTEAELRAYIGGHRRVDDAIVAPLNEQKRNRRQQLSGIVAFEI